MPTAPRTAKQVVRGHDAVFDLMLNRLCETVMLRKRRKDVVGGLPPLASFLLVGKDGIGKRYLARVLAKLLYRSAAVTVFECDKLSSDAVSQVLGAKGSPGKLADSVPADNRFRSSSSSGSTRRRPN